MPNPIYLRLKVDGNDIAGEPSVISLDREDTIECYAFDHEVNVPRDGSSGLPTARRRHGVVKIIKRIDKSTPLLYQALCNNAIVDSAEFCFFRADPTGGGTSDEHYYTVELTEGKILNVRSYIPDCLKEDNCHHGHMEEVTFSYTTISWDHLSGATSASDSWKG